MGKRNFAGAFFAEDPERVSYDGIVMDLFAMLVLEHKDGRGSRVRFAGRWRRGRHCRSRRHWRSVSTPCLLLAQARYLVAQIVYLLRKLLILLVVLIAVVV